MLFEEYQTELTQKSSLETITMPTIWAETFVTLNPAERDGLKFMFMRSKPI